MELDVSAEVGVDLATKQDIQRLARLSVPPFVEKIQVGYNGETDANGNLTLRVYDVPDGKIFSLGKVLLIADGYTPAVPYVNNATWAGIFHGSPSMANLADFAPSSPGGQIFPSTFEYGEFQAPEFKQPDNIVLGLFSGPVNTNITVMLFGQLRSITVRARPETPIKNRGGNMSRIPPVLSKRG